MAPSVNHDATSDTTAESHCVSSYSEMPSAAHLSFKCAVTESKGPRRTMEDAHSVIVPFGGIRGQGFFAIFDGHAGKQAAEWCGDNFAPILLRTLQKEKTTSIPDILNQTFHDVDSCLSRLSERSQGRIHSGCTVVTALLRLEDAAGNQSFLPPGFDVAASLPPIGPEENLLDGAEGEDDQPKRRGSILRNALKSLGGGSSSSSTSETIVHHSHAPESDDVFSPPPSAFVRRVLYCANAGDARAVLCRAGKAVRLTYDHKGTDKQEAKRITDAGGFVMSGRVNGVLNVTRSLGDSSMKEFVVGAPYTTETELGEEDEFLILACDGLWDVVDDQAAIELVRAVADPRKMAEELLDHAYRNYSTDNVTVLVVRFRNPPASVRAAT